MSEADSVDSETANLDCGDLPVRAINQAIRAAIAGGGNPIRLLRPDARHNLGVGLPQGVTLTIEGKRRLLRCGLEQRRNRRNSRRSRVGRRPTCG